MNEMARMEWSGMQNAAHQIGDPWSLLIIWEALHGTSRFDKFCSRLGFARNILSNRLSKLVDAGILVKRPVYPGARRLEYRITRKGEALRPAFQLIDEWGHGLPGKDTSVREAACQMPNNRDQKRSCLRLPEHSSLSSNLKTARG